MPDPVASLERQRENLNSLAASHPHIAEALEVYFQQNDMHFDLRKEEGIYRFEIKTSDDRGVREWAISDFSSHSEYPCGYYSNYRPGKQGMILFGMGAFCPACLEQCSFSEMNPVILVEPSFEIFLGYLTVHAYEAFFRMPQVYWFIGENAYSDVLESLDTTLEPYLIATQTLYPIFDTRRIENPSDRFRAFQAKLQQKWNAKVREMRELSSRLYANYSSSNAEKNTNVLIVEPGVDCWIQLGQGLATGFRELGYQVSEFLVSFPPSQISAYESLRLLVWLQKIQPEYIVTISHASDLLVRGIENLPVKRLIWYVDQPDHLIQYRHGSYDYLFPVWKDFAEDLKSRGGRLAGEVPVGGFPLAHVRRNELACDVGFVGTVKNTIPIRAQIPSDLLQRLDFLFEAKLREVKTPMDSLMERFAVDSSDREILIRVLDPTLRRPAMTDRQLLIYYFHVECIRIRRINILSRLSEYDLKIYGTNDWEELLRDTPIARCFQGKCLHLEECYDFYHTATISLSIHPPFLHDGPTMREMDIPLCDGFLLSDMHIHAGIRMEDFFKPGAEIALFDGEHDIAERVVYFLNRPDERKAITEAAQRRIRTDHTFKNRVQKMLSLLASEDMPEPSLKE